MSRSTPDGPADSGNEERFTGLASRRLRGSRYRQVLPYVQGDLLEIGCGESPLVTDHAERFTSYTGCDVDLELTDRLGERYPQHRYGTVDLDHEDLPEDWGPFDTILAVAVIEHLFNLELVMRRLATSLQPKGRIVLTTPTPFGNDIVLPVTARVGITSVDAFVDHINILNRRRFALLATEVGLELTTYRRFQLGMNSLAVMELP